jgi:UPF0716 protein FxsA
MPLLFLAIVIGLPILELYVIIAVGEWIGVLWTAVALVATSVIGVRLIRSQGRAVMADLRAAIAAGRPPAREVLDGALVFVGGALLIVPGFVTDVIGALLLAPPTRAVVRLLVIRHYAGRLMAYLAGGGGRRDRPDTQVYDVDGKAIDVDQDRLQR